MTIYTSWFKRLLLIFVAALVITGCSKDGKDGPPGGPGEPGRPGGTPAMDIQVLNLQVDAVTYEDNRPTIQVYASNQDGKPVAGITDMGIVVAQLTPQAASPGDAATWTRTARESGLDSYTDQKNGYYTFSPSLDGFDAALTQRYNVTAGGKGSMLADGVTPVPRREIVADFNGQGGSPNYTKDVVAHQVCTACHNPDEPLARRHSTYYTHETCATCHNGSFRTEAQWPHLVHSVHNTARAFTDSRGNEYTGEKGEQLLQNNCARCHVENEELAESANWARIPTMETCTGCHNIDFQAGQGHSQQQDNSNCVACHNSEWTAELHLRRDSQTASVINSVGMQLDLTYVAPPEGTATGSAKIAIGLVDGEGNAVDASSMLNKIKRLESITNVGPNFPVMGFLANPDNNIEAKKSIDLVLDGKLNGGAVIEDGKLTVDTGALPFGQGDTDTAFTFVGLAVCSEADQIVDCNEDGSSEYTGTKSSLAHVTASGDAPSLRHIDSVDAATCVGCHGDTWQIHKGNHAGFVFNQEQMGREVNGELRVGTDACVTCHTPEGTFSPTRNGAWEMKIHSTHNGQQVVKNCSQCHESFNLDAFSKKGAIRTYQSDTAQGYTTPRTAVCVTCHVPESIGHGLENQGAIVNGDFTQANQAAQSETCFFCHAPEVDNHGAIK
ncbi:OmcA/MtrC family decaheme c-type cytochrome [Paraferrimonas sedimenticola]|uniref:Cytochrome c n=1 Tax=Paraferrimonas sedimenticola TaxID=375674 RepID=A0AA37RW64_9GAMM|nr:OmcA/MtrC family decaheme c-type cytochrome [Paraferrimonas sedimenticola]GLP96218.1 cytochrome c [Paraferrimonas sedimenticola]